MRRASPPRRRSGRRRGRPGRLSRLAGRGGGTTLPGKLLWKLDPGAIDALAARLPQGSVAVSATNGKTTTTAMVAEILRPRVRVAHNASGANLVSGVASTLLHSRGAELGLFEVDEGALPEVTRRVRPKALLLCNLFRDQLDRYGELELVAARWREAVAALPDAQLVVNGDDPQVGALARPGGRVFGLDDPRVARPALQHAADSKYCLRCGTPYVYAAAYVGHLGDYRCPACGHARPSLDVTAREIELHGLDGASFTLDGSRRAKRGSSFACPASTTSTTRSPRRRSRCRWGSHSTTSRDGLGRFSAAFGRFERIAIGDRRVLMLLIKNPAGANEAIRTLVEGAAPRVAVVALNDAIADGRDVSWIWDVDFEPLLAGLDRLVATGSRAAELALRFAYGGLDARPDRGRARARRGARPRARAHPRRRRAHGPADVHRDARAAPDARRARARDELLGAGSMKIRVGHLYPDYLNIYADRGNIAVLAERARAARARARRAGDRDGRPPCRQRRPLLRRRRPGPRAGARRARPRREERDALREAVEGGAAFLAVCGGYQLLGRFYRDVAGTELPGIGLLPLHTIAGERRMIGDVLLECAWAGETLAGFENHAGRTILDDGAEPLGRVVSGFGNDGASGFEGCRYKRVVRHVSARPAPAAQPVVRRPAARRGARPRRRRRAVRAAARRARARGARRLGCASAQPRRQVASAPRGRRGTPPGRPAATAPGSA